MTYIPLARKWRPKTFSDLIGQEHVVQPLQNALQQDKLHHAYLFTGTRGVGKTTVARIFAKALNCQNGITAEPCLTCDNCKAIDENRFFDLIEVDGASRTRVEDTRELIENIQYAPAEGRFKIFLIDEVHMLSTHSFNALLKTLEEPPKHVKFLLATTDPQKIPTTILSRCLQFNLKPITSVLIEKQLNFILSQEQFSFDLQALSLIAEQSQGSMRDAITLTEQLISVFPQGFELATLSVFFGQRLEEYSLLLISYFLKRDPVQLLLTCEKIDQEQASYIKILHFMLIHLHQCALLKILPQTNTNEILAQCVTLFSSENIHMLFEMIEKACKSFDAAVHPKIAFQMLMLRIFYSIEKMEMAEPTSPDYEPEPEQMPEPTEEPIILPEPEPESPMPSDPSENWSSIIENIEIDGIGKTALSHSSLIAKNQNILLLAVESSYQSLFTPNIVVRIENTLSNFFNENIKIKLQTPSTNGTPLKTPAQVKKQQTQEDRLKLNQTILENEFVKTMISDCDAQIIENTMTFNTNEL